MTPLHSETSIVQRYDSRILEIIEQVRDADIGLPSGFDYTQSDLASNIDAILINVIREARASL